MKSIHTACRVWTDRSIMKIKIENIWCFKWSLDRGNNKIKEKTTTHNQCDNCVHKIAEVDDEGRTKNM